MAQNDQELAQIGINKVGVRLNLMRYVKKFRVNYEAYKKTLPAEIDVIQEVTEEKISNSRIEDKEAEPETKEE